MARGDFKPVPWGRALTAVLILLVFCPFRTGAEEPFPGYPADVRSRALRLVESAEPGKEELLEPEVRALRKTMLDRSIVSMNDVPDRIFERARKEGWEGNAGGVLRPVTRVAPFSVALWAWLVKEDLSRFAIGRLLADLEGARGAFGRYGPSLLGCATWIFLCFIAAACWFAVWTSVSMLLRAQPALSSDISRLFRALPHPELFGFAGFLVCFLAPVVAGIGVGVAAVFWLCLSAGYLRRWEIATAVFSIVLLGAVSLCGGALRSIHRVTGETLKGGWLAGEGYFPMQWPAPAAGSPFDDPRWDGMVRFARARAAMQSGDHSKAEALFTEWMGVAEDPSTGHNNRGISRQRQGRTAEALQDFEAAASQGGAGGPAYWNSYQMYLLTFRLEEASKVQESAWESLRRLRFYDYRAEEMTHGELLPSPLVVRGIWKELFTPRWEWLHDGGEGQVTRFLFRPLPPKILPAFLFLGALWILAWKPLSMKVWKHGTCRACGTSALVVGDEESADICNQCRAQVGGGLRAGEEREHRLQVISLHRRYVRSCSIAVPGAGAMWAGKGVSSVIFGLLLSVALGALTVSTGAGDGVSPLISSMMDGIAKGALAMVAVLWAAGAAWSWKSFGFLQFKYNIAPRR